MLFPMAPSSASGKGKRASSTMKIGKSDSVRLLGGFHKVHKIWRSANFTRSIGGRAAAAAVPISKAASFTSDKGASGSSGKLPAPSAQSLQQNEIRERTAAAAHAAVTVPIASSASVEGAAGSEEKGPTSSPAQSPRQEEIGEKTAADNVASTAAAIPTPMAASSASVEGAARSEEKGPTSTAGAGSLRAAIVLVLTVVAVAVTTVLLVHFHGHPMRQVWILSLSICSYVFIFLLLIRRNRSFCADFYRLSYGPLLAFCSASGIGSTTTATFVLLFSMAWASGNLGYSLALHRLHEGTETAIRTVPSSSYPTKNGIRGFNATLHNVAPFTVLLWTLLMVLVVNVAPVPDELYVLIILSNFGWIHVALWIIIVTLVYMHQFPLKEPVGWLLPVLLIGMPLSLIAICFVSQMLAVLCHLLLMMALVAFLWYNIAIYIQFLATGAPRTTTQGNEDKIGLMKSDPRFRTTSSKSAATLGNEDRQVWASEV